MLSVALFVFVGWIASVCLHEFGHAIVAYWGGDTSVKDKGYLTLNPLKYTDVSYSLVLPLVFLLLGGIPLPGAAVYIDRSRLRGRVWETAVSLAGPAMSMLVAIALSLPFITRAFPIDSEVWIWPALAFLAVLTIASVILNLLPIPSLDGFGAIEPWLPPKIRQKTQQWSRYGVLLLFGLLWFSPQASRGFWSLVNGIAGLLQIPPDLTARGYALFNEWAAFFLIGMIGLVILWQQVILKLLYHLQLKGVALPYQKQIVNAAYGDALQQGDRLLQNQQFDAAITAYDRASQINPGRYEPWYGKATALLAQKNNEAAIAAYEQVISLQPDFYAAWHGKGLAFYRMGELKQSLAAYEQGLVVKPDDLPSLIDCGTTLHNLGRYEAAIASYNQALAINPDIAAAHYNVACCYALLKQHQVALEALQKATDLDPQYGAIAQVDEDFDGMRSLLRKSTE